MQDLLIEIEQGKQKVKVQLEPDHLEYHADNRITKHLPYEVTSIFLVWSCNEDDIIKRRRPWPILFCSCSFFLMVVMLGVACEQLDQLLGVLLQNVWLGKPQSLPYEFMANRHDIDRLCSPFMILSFIVTGSLSGQLRRLCSSGSGSCILVVANGS